MSTPPSASLLGSQSLDALRRRFQEPEPDARPLMRWWWFGPAVTHAELEREMRLMRDAGIGGFEVQPVYPLEFQDTASHRPLSPFLSDAFLDALRFVGRRAHDLGLRFDLTLGSGWPYGGPQVPVHLSASRLCCERASIEPGTQRVPLPQLGPGEKLIAIFAAGRAIELSQVRKSAVWLPPNFSTTAEVAFFVQRRTGQQVKRASVGAEGFVVDHYDRATVEHYLTHVGEPLLRACDGHLPFAVFCDSLEVFGADWTDNLPEEFLRRRGYDVRPLLLQLMEDRGSAAQSLRHDWMRTLTELLEENFLQPAQEWARAHGTRFRVQCYGTPPAIVSSYAFVDLNEGEGTPWRHVSACRLASSAAHILERQPVSSEAWTWLNSPPFRASPLDVKAEAHIHFLQGINQLIGHGWPYSPESLPFPGWSFYAAAVFNERNPWWNVMRDVMGYVQRLSSLLRQGRPCADVAFYLPNSDGWGRMAPGHADMWKTLLRLIDPEVIGRIHHAGYALDFFDDRFLAERAHVSGDALRMGPTAYQIVVLPGIEALPLATLERLDEFVRHGGRLIATDRLPDTTPGFQATEDDHQRVRDTVRGWFNSAVTRARFVSRSADIGAALRDLLRPDFHATDGAEQLGFVHRVTDTVDIYFIANTGNTSIRTRVTLRTSTQAVEWWDPLSGDMRAAVAFSGDNTGTTLSLALEPHEARVAVLRHDTPLQSQQPQQPSQSVKSHERSNESTAAIDLSEDWEVQFGTDGPRVPMAKLRSWTEDKITRHFSGVATYEKTFELPTNWPPPGRRVVLDFGEGRPAAPMVNSEMTHGMSAAFDPPVREAAVIFLNGERCGSLWCPPYLLDVTRLLRPGRNQLSIQVSNLALNAMASLPLPDYSALHERYGERFIPQDADRIKPQPAGLLKPVCLRVTAD